MALLEEIGSDRREVQTARGEGRMLRIGPRVLLTIVSGYMEPPVGEFIRAGLEDAVVGAPDSKLYSFIDGFDVTGYDAHCRRLLTAWTLENRGAFAEIHLGGRSNLVAMGIEVANLALGGLLHVHWSRTSLEAALQRAVREAGASE